MVANADTIVVTEDEFTEPFSSPGTFGNANREKTPGETPWLIDNDVEPIRHETGVRRHNVMFQAPFHHFIERVTSEGTCGSGNTEKAPGPLPEMLTSTERMCECKVCGFTFKRSCDLQRHATVHIGEETYSCSFCDKKFPTKCEHETHELHHKGELPQCPVCAGRYVDLQKHMLIHSADSYKHVCSVCQKACRTVATLKQALSTS